MLTRMPLACVTPALERPEGVSQQDYGAAEEFQQRTNAVSLEKVKAYYRRLRYFVLHCNNSPPAVHSPALWSCFTVKGEFTRWCCVSRDCASVAVLLHIELFSRSAIIIDENWEICSKPQSNRILLICSFSYAKCGMCGLGILPIQYLNKVVRIFTNSLYTTFRICLTDLLNCLLCLRSWNLNCSRCILVVK